MAQPAGPAVDGASDDAHEGPAHRLLHHLVAGDTEVQSEVLENLSLAVNYRKWIVEAVPQVARRSAPGDRLRHG